MSKSTIEIKSVMINDKNLNEHEDLGILKTDGSFLSIKEQYKNKLKSPMAGFYMVRDNKALMDVDYRKYAN